MTQVQLPTSLVFATSTIRGTARVEPCGRKLVCTRLLVYSFHIASFQKPSFSAAVFSEHIPFVASICLLNGSTRLSCAFPTWLLSYLLLFIFSLSYHISRIISWQPWALSLLRRKQPMLRNFREVARPGRDTTGRSLRYTACIDGVSATTYEELPLR